MPIEIPTHTRKPNEQSEQYTEALGQILELLIDNRPADLLAAYNIVGKALVETSYPRAVITMEAESPRDTGIYPRLTCPYDDCDTLLSTGMWNVVEVKWGFTPITANDISYHDEAIEVDVSDPDYSNRGGFYMCRGCNQPVDLPFGWEDNS